MSEDLVRVVIVGAGVSGSKLMLRPLKRMENRARVIGICDPDVERARDVASRNGIPSAFPSLQDALAAGGVDLVCVSTPPSTHHATAREALEGGAHVVVEKPFTRTLEEAHDLHRLNEDRGLALAVVHNHKFRPGMVQGLDLFRSGVTGPLIAINVNWVSARENRMIGDPNCWVHDETGGAFREVLPHILYNTYQFVGPMELAGVDLFQRSERPWMEFDEALIRLTSESAVITVSVSFNGEYETTTIPRTSWTVQGRKAHLHVNYYKSFVVRTRNVDLITGGIRALGAAVANRLGSDHFSGHGEVISRLIDHIRSGEPHPVPWEESLHVMEMTDRIAREIESRTEAAPT